MILLFCLKWIKQQNQFMIFYMKLWEQVAVRICIRPLQMCGILCSAQIIIRQGFSPEVKRILLAPFRVLWENFKRRFCLSIYSYREWGAHLLKLKAIP
jgi:hypothetical protein